MSITLLQLCEDSERKYSMRLIAGEAGMNSIVRWVHILEYNGSEPFLHGGELVITAGIGINDPAGMERFISSLRDCGACGAIIASEKAIPENVTSFCNDNSFPLFHAKDSKRMIDISYDMCRRISGSEKSEKALNDALCSIISDPQLLRSYKKLLIRSGFSDDGNYTAAAVHIVPDSGNNADISVLADNKSLLGKIRNMTGFCASFVCKGVFVMLFRDHTDDDLKKIFALPEFDPAGNKTYIGISELQHGFENIPSAYGQAESALVYSVMYDSRITLYKDTGILQLILGVKNKTVLYEYVKKHIGVLFEYDSLRNTDLAETLRIYLNNNSSVNETAAIEMVHRNTVNSKIRTARELLGHELDDISKSRLIIAFLINDVLRIYNDMPFGNPSG